MIWGAEREEERTSPYDTQNTRIIGIPDTCRADRQRHNVGGESEMHERGITAFH